MTTRKHLLFRRRVIAFWGILLLLIISVTIFAPVIAPYDPNEVDLENGYSHPNNEHILGTDVFGRDVLSRLLFGGQVSLSISILSVTITTFIGILIGGISGYIGGWLDSFIMRLLDALLAIPNLILIIAFQAILNKGMISLIIIIGATSWLSTARIVRGQFIELKEKQFVKTARLLGTSAPRMIVQHFLRNSLSAILVIFVFNCASALFVEVSLSFLGIGVPPDIPSWGNMMMNAQSDLFIGAWWLIIPPGLMIVLTVLSINYLGEETKKKLAF